MVTTAQRSQHLARPKLADEVAAHGAFVFVTDAAVVVVVPRYSMISLSIPTWRPVLSSRSLTHTHRHSYSLSK